MRTFIIGDIHGHFDKLVNCLNAVNFDYENDKLIQLGDVVDRGSNSYMCIEELLKIKNKVCIQGNHDECWFNSLLKGEPEQGLLWRQGAKQTYQSYLDYEVNPQIHIDFFRNQVKYYIDEERRYFVHGGFNRHYPIDKQLDNTVYTWDRDLFHQALSYKNMTDEEYYELCIKAVTNNGLSIRYIPYNIRQNMGNKKYSKIYELAIVNNINAKPYKYKN
jgi:serine/threonine protein phosphatase 1